MTGPIEPNLAKAMALAALGKRVNALDRCKTLANAKEAYLTIYPQTGHGSARPTNVVGMKSPPAFVDYAAQKTGFSRRSIAKDVQIWQGLSPGSRSRLPCTDMAANQRDLWLLSRQTPERQKTILDNFLADGKASLAVALHLTHPDLSRVPTRDLIAELWKRETNRKGAGDGKST